MTFFLMQLGKKLHIFLPKNNICYLAQSSDAPEHVDIKETEILLAKLPAISLKEI